jgi:hypothetical protein
MLFGIQMMVINGVVQNAFLSRLLTQLVFGVQVKELLSRQATDGVIKYSSSGKGNPQLSAIKF